MTTKITLVILITASLFSISASPRSEEPGSINFFTGTYKEGLAEAKKQNKLVFIDAYTTWCGPCRLLSKTTFADKDVAAYFNEHFINLAIDMEKGDGPQLSAKYKVSHFPTLLIADSDGNRITFTVGYIQPDDLIGFAKYALHRNNTGD